MIQEKPNLHEKYSPFCKGGIHSERRANRAVPDNQAANRRSTNWRRAVVTGIGVVSPIGSSKEEFASALREGLSGEGEIQSFDATDFPVKRACEVKEAARRGGPETGSDTPLLQRGDTEIPPHPPFAKGDTRGFSVLDPFILYALDAAEQAVEDSGLDWNQVDRKRFGVVASSSKGGVKTLEEELKRARLTHSPPDAERVQNSYPPDRASFWIAKQYGLGGPTKCVITACATGTSSLIEAARLIERGEVDLCLAGASDASVTPLVLAGYYQMGVYAPEGMCPYDRRRKGFIVGEGAGVVLLEERNFAEARGAKIYGEILAHGTASDSYHMISFNPEGDGLALLLENLLEKADVKAEDLNYLNMHGTSTQQGDLYETVQIKKAFGRQAYRIPCSATKSMVGHMLGASGAIEFITCLLAMEQSFVPPTIHYEVPDPECDLDYTANRMREADVNLACSISMGFGGHLAAILVKKP